MNKLPSEKIKRLRSQAKKAHENENFEESVRLEYEIDRLRRSRKRVKSHVRREYLIDGVFVTDHAVLRYLQTQGVDIEKVRREIAERTKDAVKMKASKVSTDFGSVIIIGNSIVTIIPK